MKQALHEARVNVLTMLGPMFERAKRQRLWFYSPYRGLWFSPEQLREEWKRGRFIWGPSHWQLRVKP